jgi:hypothetical protein
MYKVAELFVFALVPDIQEPSTAEAGILQLISKE